METELPVEPDAPGIARGFARSAVGDLPGSTVDDLILLTSELVAEAVRDRSEGPQDPLRLMIRRSSDSVRVTVRGVARGEQPLEPSSPPSRGERGLRTVLLEEVASGWGVEPDDPTAVWFELAVS